MTGLKDLSGRLARWALKPQEYDATICYKSGKEHKDADGLSRGPLLDTTEAEENEERMFLNVMQDEFVDDKYIQNIKNILERKIGVKPAVQENFKIWDNKVFKRNPTTLGQPWLLIVPKKNRNQIIENFHDHITAGHLGITRTYNRLKARYFWPSMLKNVEQFVRTCHLCQSRKKPPTLAAGLLQPIPPTKMPF